MGMKISAVLAGVMLAGLALLSGCAGPQVSTSPGSGQNQEYSVQGNKIYIENGPAVIIEDSFKYAGAEGVPSPQGSLKRQIFAGKRGEFVTVTIFDSTADFVRESVTDARPNKWEYRIKQVTGPQWIRLTGNKSPCCVNLLRSEYLFIPAGEKWQQGASLPALPEGAVPGRVVLISFGTPIPEGLSPNTWAGNDDLLGGDDLQINYDVSGAGGTGGADGPGLLIPGLSADKLKYLDEQEARAAQVYRVE